MNNREQKYLELALEYRDKYNNLKWWNFRQRGYWKRHWNYAVDCMIRFSNLNNNTES